MSASRHRRPIVRERQLELFAPPPRPRKPPRRMAPHDPLSIFAFVAPSDSELRALGHLVEARP